MNIRNFGANIKRERIKNGMSQAKLAELSGITAVALCRYERNQRIPMVDVAYEIATVLGVTIDDLVK